MWLVRFNILKALPCALGITLLRVGPWSAKHAATNNLSLLMPRLFSAFAAADIKTFLMGSLADLGVFSKMATA
jgi:hypothetical protein